MTGNTNKPFAALFDNAGQKDADPLHKVFDRILKEAILLDVLSGGSLLGLLKPKSNYHDEKTDLIEAIFLILCKEYGVEGGEITFDVPFKALPRPVLGYTNKKHVVFTRTGTHDTSIHGMIYTLCHEFVHVLQYVENRQKDIDSDHIEYDGVRYSIRDIVEAKKNKEDYMNLPWEKDAFERTPVLVEKLREKGILTAADVEGIMDVYKGR